MNALSKLGFLISFHQAVRKQKRCLEISFDILIAAIVCIAASFWPASASAQGFPNKPLRMILRAPPGGADDIQARMLAAQLTPILGQQVVIDYRPGAGGLVAWEYVAKLPPDGYTIMLTASGLTSVRSLRPSVTIDPWRDFAWISQVSSFMLMFVAHPSLPVKNLKDLIQLARKRPGELSYGSTGVGATPHLAAEYFKSVAHIDSPHVPYRGAAPMFIDLLGGRLAWGTSTTASPVPHVKSGRLRALGVTGPKRLADLPDVPTVAEGAGLPGFEFTGFYAIIAPAGTPKEIVNTLSAAVAKAMSAPGFKERFTTAAPGMEPVATTPDELLEIAKKDGEKVDKIVRAAHIQAD
jgi:tripartite-type tricarboxylate transporter receptor subunit TctC